MQKRNLIFLTASILFVVLAGYFYARDHQRVSQSSGGHAVFATAQYACDYGQSLAAAFRKGTPVLVQPGQPPVPNASVDLTLSDGRTLTLPQTVSADGARYANRDESFVFWSKGNTALIEEFGHSSSYTNCIRVASPAGDLTAVYHNAAFGYTVRYPGDWRLNIKYTNSTRGANAPMLPGVLFRIPASMATGTNLSSYDTGLSIETLGTTTSCTAADFLGQSVGSMNETINNTTYSVATTTDAGAGNRYETVLYALPGSNPCLGIRYFTHYSDIHNYPEGTIQPFDRTGLMNEFNAIRDSLVRG